MYAIGLVTAVFAVVAEMFIEWKYGPAAVFGLLLFSLGIRAKSPACSSVGAVILMLTLLRPAA